VATILLVALLKQLTPYNIYIKKGKHITKDTNIKQLNYYFKLLLIIILKLYFSKPQKRQKERK
jgi:uncharacterized membrane protein